MATCKCSQQLHWGRLVEMWEGGCMNLHPPERDRCDWFSLSQSNDILNAILEGYPKSKKELYVRSWVIFNQLPVLPMHNIAGVFGFIFFTVVLGTISVFASCTGVCERNIATCILLHRLIFWLKCCIRHTHTHTHTQEEIGIETDEDYSVTMPS